MARIITTDIFIERSRKKFGDKFDYSKAIYTKRIENITLICKEHNEEFQVIVGSHYRSDTGGCPVCSYNKTQEDNRNRLLEKRKSYISDVQKIYGNRYDYSLVNYNGAFENIVVICPEHGKFEVVASKHEHRGQGCPTCALEENISLGERYVFDNYNKDFIDQYIIDNDKYLSNKPYDFLLEDFDIILEVNGSQHYYTKFNMTDEDLKNRQEIDKNKKKKAIERGYGHLVVNTTNGISSLMKVIEILNSSTTIEKFKDNIVSLNGVEYTQASGNKRSRK